MTAGIREYSDTAFRGFPQPIYNSWYCPKLDHDLLLLHTRDADKSLARPGGKQINVSVRMA